MCLSDKMSPAFPPITDKRIDEDLAAQCNSQRTMYDLCPGLTALNKE